MGANQDDIRVRIAGDIADIKKALAELKKDTRDAGAAAKKSGDDWEGFGKRLDNIRRRIGDIAGAYLSFRGVQATISAIIRNTVEADAVQAQLEARVRSTGGAAGFTTEQLLAMASQLQSVTTYGDEAIATMESVLLTFTKVRGEQFERATEATLNLATALNTDLKSAALQVGKALNDPLLGMTALQRAGIQLTEQQKAQIRRFIELNDVTSAQRVILAELETQFGGAARAARDTLGGALQSLNNAFGDLLEGRGGNVEEARSQVESLTQLLQKPSTIAAFDNITAAVLRLVGAMVKVIELTVDTGKGIGTILAQATTGISNPDDQIEVLEAAIKRNASELRIARDQFESFDKFYEDRIDKARERIRKLELEQQALEDAQRVLRQSPETFTQTGGGGGAPAAKPEPAAAPAAPAVQIDAREALRQLQAQLAAAGTLLDDEIKRINATLDRDFSQNLVRFRDYFARRVELEQQAIDKRIEQQRVALRLLDEEIALARERGEEVQKQEAQRAELVARITVLERQRGDVAVNAARAQADAEKTLNEQLERVRIRLLELQGDTVGARTAELESEYRELLKRLEIEGNTEGAALVRRLIDVELAKTRLAELEETYKRTMAELARAEQSVEIQVQTGVMGEREGRRAIIELHRQTAEEVEALIPLMRELAAATGDPEAIERLKDLELQVEQLRSTTDTAARAIREGFRDAGEDALSSVLDRTKEAKDAFQDFIADIRRRVADLIAERVFDKLFEKLGSLGTGGTGGGGGGGWGKIFAGLFHQGGIAGQPKSTRAISLEHIFAAPRFHSGGLVAGEVPAVLRSDEEVLTADDPRHRRNFRGVGDIIIQAKDAESFRRQSQSQLAADTATMLARSRNRNSR